MTLSSPGIKMQRIHSSVGFCWYQGKEGENRSSARGPKGMGRIWKGIYQSWLQSHSDVQSVKGRRWRQKSFRTSSVSPRRALEHHQDGCCHVCAQGWYIRLVLPTQFSVYMQFTHTSEFVMDDTLVYSGTSSYWKRECRRYWHVRLEYHSERQCFSRPSRTG